jgi:predicted Zn finger-like uncharacterized protein
MLIVCPSCATAFRVTRTVLGDAGRQVRCAQCRTVWLATPESAIEDDAMATMGAGASAARAAPPPPPPPPPPPEDDADWGAAFAEEAETKSASKGGEGVGATGNDVDFDAPVPAAEAPSLQPSADVPPLPSRIVDSGDTPPARPSRPKADEPPKRRFRKPALPRARSFRFSPSVILLMLGSALLATFLLGREQVVRTVPDSASVYERIGLPVNLRGVEFRDVKGANEVVDGVVVLVVEGQLVNITSRAADLPRLRLAVRDAGGKEIYTWTATPPAPRLEAGQAVPFRSRLASPPPDGASVEVRFFTRIDAGGR